MHIRQLPSGTWRVIVQHQGHTRSGTAKTRSLAQQRGAELLVALGGEPGSIDTTVAELLDAHLAKHGYAPTTMAEMVRMRALLPDAFLARRVPAVRPLVIDGLYRELEADGWSVHRIRRTHTLLSAAFKRAVRWGWTPANPCRDAEVPPEPEPNTYTPTDAEAARLLTAADQVAPAFGLFVRIAALTGARRGEVAGLQYGDVDHTDLEIRFVRAVSYTPASGIHIGDTKTGKRGRRTLAITPALAARIDSHRIAQDKELLEHGIRLGPDAWLFMHPHRGGALPWLPSSATSMWATARDAAGIPRVRLHDMRHYVGTTLIEEGYSARAAADRLGHSKPSMTQDRYASSRKATDQAAAELLERKLGA